MHDEASILSKFEHDAFSDPVYSVNDCAEDRFERGIDRMEDEWAPDQDTIEAPADDRPAQGVNIGHKIRQFRHDRDSPAAGRLARLVQLSIQG